MAKAFVQCRICKQRFDRKDPSLVEGVDYVKPSERMYYHKKCYEEYQTSKLDIHASMADEIWFSAAWDFLRKELCKDFRGLFTNFKEAYRIFRQLFIKS